MTAPLRSVASQVGIVGRLLLVWSITVAFVGLGVAASWEPDVDQSVGATGIADEGTPSPTSPTESVLAEPPRRPGPDTVPSIPPQAGGAVSATPTLTGPGTGTVPGIPVPPVTAPPVSGTADDGWVPRATSAGVHLFDIDTGRVRQLAGPGSFAGLPSPNGRRIAYVAAVDASFRFRVEVAEVDNGAVEVVAEALDGSVMGWAPDNRSLLVAIRTPDANEPTLTEAHVLTPGGGTRRVSPVGIDALPIGWSPITNLIAYSAPDGTHVVRPDGGDDRLVQPSSDGDRRESFASSWSPVGPELLFAVIDRKVDEQARPRNDHRIVARNPTTGVQRDIARPVVSFAGPRWSGDGLGVCYTTYEEGGSRAWTDAGATGQTAHELDWAGAGDELIAIRPSHGGGPREVVGITPGGSARTILGAHEGDTYFNIASVPGTRLAVVDIAPEDFYR